MHCHRNPHQTPYAGAVHHITVIPLPAVTRDLADLLPPATAAEITGRLTEVRETMGEAV
jgi:hypothetical protein